MASSDQSAGIFESAGWNPLQQGEDAKYLYSRHQDLGEYDGQP